MLPSSLNSVYQQYKADTDAVAQWLAVTAKQHGYRDASSSSLTTTRKAPGGRPKGKSRKGAKAKAKAPLTTTATAAGGPKKRHVIKIKDFEPMAAHIASCGGDGIITVPRYFSKALNRVISVRRSFTERLASAGGQVGAASDKSHSFFVDVLDSVRTILQPLSAAADAQTKSISTATTATDKAPSMASVVDNLFGALEVYHPDLDSESDEPDESDEPGDETAPLPPAGTEDYVAETGTSTADLIFVTTALLNDFAALRKEIQSLWIEHDVGALALAPVSVATNTALELARSMEAEVAPLLEAAAGSTHEFINIYFQALCRAVGVDSLAKEQPGDPYNLAAYDIAEPCLINTLTLIASFTGGGATPRHASIQDYNGKFGWYDETLRGDGDTPRQRWTQDLTAVLELLPDLSFLVSKLGRLSVIDELTRGLAQQMQARSRTTPLWLALGIQVYLDILHEFAPVCDGALDAMRAESRRIKHGMRDVPASSPARATVLRAAGLWDQDPIWAQRKLAVTAGLLPRMRTPPFKFLRRNPMYCGLLINHMRATAHEAGLPYAATPGALVGVVQLYHALRNERLLSPEAGIWEDLDIVWTLQGNAAFFVGDLPKTKEAYFKNYSLSIGTSVTHWAAAKSRRKTKHKVNIHSDNRRILKPFAYLSRVVSHRLRHADGARIPWSAAAVQELLDKSFAEQLTDSRSHLKPESRRVVEEVKAHHAAFSPADLASAVARFVEQEQSWLCIDFFTIHHEAWLFLERLHAAIVALPDGPASLSSDAQMLPYVSGVCLAAAAGQSLDRAQTVPASDTLLRAAAEVMQTFVNEGHGQRMRDAAQRGVPEAHVEKLNQSLALWAIDDNRLLNGSQGRPTHSGGRSRGGEELDLNMLLQLLKAADLDPNGQGSDGSTLALENMLRLLGQN